MLADWYFCAAIRLSPKATHDFLDLLAALDRRPGGPPDDRDEVHAALDQLQYAEAGQLLYAVPRVLRTATAFAEDQRITHVASARLREAEQLVGTGPGLLTSTSASRSRATTDRVRDIVERVSGRPNDDRPRSDRPYLDTIEFGPEVLVLAALDDLCRQQRKAAVAAADDPTIVALLRRAVRGEHGRLAATLAGAVLTRIDPARILSTLASGAAGTAWLEPDLLALLATASFGTGPDIDHTRLAAESADHAVLHGLIDREPEPTGGRLDEIRGLLGCPGSPPEGLAAVLWHLTLGRLAGPEQGPDAIPWLRDWLSTPATPPPPTMPGSAVPSPWIARRDSKWGTARREDTQQDRERKSKFQRCSDPLRFMGLLGAAGLAVELMRAAAPEPGKEDPALEFLLHTADVLADVRHRDLWTKLARGNPMPPDVRLPGPLAGLALHLNTLVARIGTCRDRASKPTRIVRWLISQGTEVRPGTESAKLHEVAASLGATQWIYDAASGLTGLSELEPSNRWFVAPGDGPVARPPARQLLAWIVRRMHEQAAEPGAGLGWAGLVSRPQLLLEQLWPNEPTDTLADWTTRLSEERARLGAAEFLLSKPVPVERWRELSDAAQQHVGGGGAPLALATVRLAAALLEPSPAELFDPWFAAWAQLVDAINTPMGFSRENRRHLISLFSLAPPDIDGRYRLRHVLEKAVDILVEFSQGAPSDLWLLRDALIADGFLGAETLQVLRTRLLHSVSVPHRPAASGHALNSPNSVLAGQRTRNLRRQIIQVFLNDVGASQVLTATSPHATLAQLYRGLWEGNQLWTPPRSVAEDATPSAVVDPRWLDALSISHRDQRINYRVVDCCGPDELDATGLPRIADPSLMDPEERERWFAGITGLAPTLGVVCAADTNTVWVNCGAPSPVAVIGTAEVGEPVRVELERPTPGEPVRAARLTALPAGAPRPGEVRTAVVCTRAGSPDAGELVRVEVTGVSDATPSLPSRAVSNHRKAHAAWVQRWDPDTTAAYRPGSEVHTVARLANDGFWYPVDRGMTELVAALTAAKQVAGAPKPTPVTIVTAGTRGASTWRLCTEPGVCYLVDSADWLPLDRNRLVSLGREGDLTGLRVRLSLAVDEETGLPRLTMGGRSPDFTNPAWAALDTAPGLVAEVALDGTWVLAVPESEPTLTTVRVVGLDTATTTRTGVVVGSWDAVDQRTGTMEASPVTLHTLKNPDQPTDDLRFDRLHRLQPGDLLTVDRLLGRAPRDGAWLAMTTDGMVVDVDAESITMLPITGTRERPLGRGRTLLVHNTAPRRNHARGVGQPLPIDELLRDTSQSVRHFATSTDHLTGVCAALPDGSAQGGTLYTLWLQINGRPHVITVPATAFTVLPVRAGDPLSADRHPDGGWVVEARPRFVRTRALWEVHRTGQVPAQRVYLGTVEDGDGLADVSLERGSPRLTLTPATPNACREHLDPMRGRPAEDPLADAEVTVRGPRVLLTTTAGTLSGGATSFVERDATYRVVGARISAEVVEVSSGQELWQLERQFDLQQVTRRRPAADQHQLARAWEEYLAGDRHVHGALLDGRLRLSALHAPDPGGGWTDLVDLDDDEYTWVDSEYSREDVRAVLVKRDGRWLASFAGTTPFSLDDAVVQLRQLGMSVRPNAVRLPVGLRYAGRIGEQGQARHRFEWGFGWRAEIPEDRIEVVGKPLTGAFPMFFGETLTHAGFPRRGQHTVIDLDKFTIEETVSRQIYDEARNRIVHRVEVDVFLASGKVIVRTVHGRQRGFTAGESNDSAALPITRAELDDDTARRLLAEVAEDPNATSDQPHRRELLARLDEHHFTRSQGRALRFFGVRSLAAKQRLFMVAGDIVERDNDVVLELELPPGLSGWRGRRPVVQVQRRQFSSRESLLRQLHRADRGFLKGSVLLVEVEDQGRAEHVWRGTTKLSLSRRVDHLFDYVRLRDGRCYAVLTSVSSAGVGLDFRPGVYFRVPADRLDAQPGLTPRSVVRLDLTPNGRLAVVCAVPDDRAYLPETGRPVVLLPKQPLLRDKVAADMANKERMFTVAGLPGIQPTAVPPESDGATVMKTAHPKIAVVRIRDDQAVIAAANGKGPVVGRVHVDRSAGEAFIELVQGERRPANWAQLSFADAGTWQIADSLGRHGWTFHDRLTGWWPVVKNNIARFTPKALNDSDTVTAAHGPVFFADGRSLRYPPDQLRRFGFPIGDVVNRMSDEIGDKPSEYVVASPVLEESGGLWIEIAPGRVVEVSADLLVAGPGDQFRSLRHLDWSRFAAGDRVRLARYQPENDHTQVSCIALHSWIAGPRAAFRGRTLLPIADTDSRGMRLELGWGRYRLFYPVSRAGLPKRSDPKAGWLGADNTFRPAYRQDAPRVGDTVLITRHGKTGVLTACGLYGWTVRVAPAGEHEWPGCEWLHTALSDVAGLERWMQLFRGSLPVTVEQVGEREIVVSRRRQPPGRVDPGRWVRGQVVDLIDDTTVLVTTGPSLLTVAVPDLVPGLPAGLAAAAVRALAEERRPKWFHAVADGTLIGGLPVETVPSDVLVVAQQVIGDEHGTLGVLCRQIDSAGYRWLPAEELGWVAGLSEDEVTGFTTQRSGSRIAGAVRADGSLSVADARDGTHRFAALQPGSCFRVVLEQERINQTGPHRYLATLYQTDVLVEFETSSTFPLGGDPINVEVSTVTSRPQRRVLVVERGERRIALDLPHPLVAALRGGPGLAASVDRTSTDLVRCVRNGGNPDDLRAGLSVWWRQYGDAALGLRADWLDASSLLAATLAAAQLETGQFGPLSVWLGWQAGVRAARTLHAEPLVVEWLQHPDRLRTGEWQRLTEVAEMIDVEVTLAKANQIAAFCAGVLGRAKVREDPGLTAIANSLLVAIGEAPAAPPAPGHARLARLAALGRALTPPIGALTAQSALLDRQQLMLRAAFTDLVGDAAYLPLLPPALPWPDSRVELAHTLATTTTTAFTDAP
ncbi:hypothetical protein ACFVYA_37690 [Amycolatopsis sp. NPDC058278]|uniref:hypothetical protein n=1 Tax=Amycolatopsis sp. NPDC058278 TaxID=3346417 RepID=UPI0036DD6F06